MSATDQPDPASQELVKAGAEKIKDEDVQKVVDREGEIYRKFEGRGPLGRFIHDGRLLLDLVKDYWQGRYRQIPYATVAAVAFSLIYIFNPLDLMPDVLPIIGQIDDVAVLGACLFLIEQDLKKYEKWKEAGGTSTEIVP
jgi:uncharacterized membrane protein YkvA (DUF1232 family)